MSKYAINLEISEASEASILCDLFASMDMPSACVVASKMLENSATRSFARKIVHRTVSDLCKQALLGLLNQTIKNIGKFEPYDDFAAHDDESKLNR